MPSSVEKSLPETGMPQYPVPYDSVDSIAADEEGLDMDWIHDITSYDEPVFDDNVNEAAQQIEEFAVELVSPEAKREVQALAREARMLSVSVLGKVGEQLGSNEGGWYEHKETHQRYYIKFYKNPEQARAEFITNAIYEKLGIGSVQSQLFEMNGKVAIASEEILGATGSTREELVNAQDVRRGFIADAYLGNWDVVGLVFDNIVKGGDGHFYRIDNGGALTFRAQGGSRTSLQMKYWSLRTCDDGNFPPGKSSMD